jgi:hypothetical protein
MRVRHHDREPEERPGPTGGEPGLDSTELRQRGAALLAAADEVVSRALSRNSAEFLAQNRQAGGQ